MSSRKLCPYCQTEVTPRDEEVVCPSCQVPHHSECWEENGGCAVYGCRSANPEARHATLEVSPNTNFVPVGGRLPLAPGQEQGLRRARRAGSELTGARLLLTCAYWAILALLLVVAAGSGFLVLLGLRGGPQTVMEVALAGAFVWSLIVVLPWLDGVTTHLRATRRRGREGEE